MVLKSQRLTKIQELEIENITLDLEDEGQSGNVICPVCEGGNSKEPSFAVKRSGTKILYLCRRATCGVKGYITTGFSCFSKPSCSASAFNAKRNKYYGPTIDLSKEMKFEIQRNWHLTDEEIARSGLLEAPLTEGSKFKANRLFIPVRGVDGGDNGAVLRTINGDSPKTLNYIFDGTPVPKDISWQLGRRSTRNLLIVEDSISAIRGSTYLDSVALLGTNLTQEKVYEIIAMEYDKYFLALDKDATVKALQISRDVGFMFEGRLKVLSLNRDIKNMTRDELRSFVNANNLLN